MLGRHLLKSWSSTQGLPSLSSGEAEYYGVVEACGIGLGLQALMEDLGLELPVRGWTDRFASMGMCGRQGLGKQRHIDTRCLWIQHAVRSRMIELSEEEREKATRTHQQDCWQHLRNIFLAEMSKAQAAYMKDELKAELETFNAWERMSTEYSQLLRASYKEFHLGCRYYKGKGKPYDLWLRETHPKVFFVNLERADGGRQVQDVHTLTHSVRMCVEVVVGGPE